MLLQTVCPSADVVARLAACLDAQTGDTVPPLWHWALFLDAVPASQLGRDGHRAAGGLIAHNPALSSRVWAGGRIDFHHDIAIGSSLRQESSIIETREREGRSGRLVVVTVLHRICSPAELLIEERQDLIFRSPESRIAAVAPTMPAPPGACTRTIIPDEILLFRFSAATFNAHRIHYDWVYATTVEHYPGLVVHGPLQAILLSGHLAAACPGAVMRTFEYRSQTPAFANRELALEAWPDAADPRLWYLQTRNPEGAVCMSARATIQ